MSFWLCSLSPNISSDTGAPAGKRSERTGACPNNSFHESISLYERNTTEIQIRSAFAALFCNCSVANGVVRGGRTNYSGDFNPNVVKPVPGDVQGKEGKLDVKSLPEKYRQFEIPAVNVNRENVAQVVHDYIESTPKYDLSNFFAQWSVAIP
jgi:hypothetical protein